MKWLHRIGRWALALLIVGFVMLWLSLAAFAYLLIPPLV